MIQIGTEIAVLLYFRRDIWRHDLAALVGATGAPRPPRRPDGLVHHHRSLPIVVLGVLLKDVIERDFRSLWLIGCTLVVLGVVLGIADRVGGTSRRLEHLGLRDAVLMGSPRPSPWCRACPAPGPRCRWAACSATTARRPPATPSCWPFRRDRRRGLRAQGHPGSDNPYGWGPTIVATVVSFVVGYAAIAWLLRYVTTRSYTPFVLYRVALGALVLVLLGAGVIAA